MVFVTFGKFSLEFDINFRCLNNIMLALKNIVLLQVDIIFSWKINLLLDFQVLI